MSIVDTSRDDILNKAFLHFRLIQDEFSKMNTGLDLSQIAVAVSGGADSIALLHLLHEWSKNDALPFKTIHAVIVDHNLRDKSAMEAMHVSKSLSSLDHFVVSILNVDWGQKKPDTGLMKAARDQRYRLIADYCTTHNIAQLYVGHHADDQAETFLMRLAKGSGIDGLRGMNNIQKYEEKDLYIMRPLLGFTHDELVAYCKRNNKEWVEDPTNQNLSYTRNRMRASMHLLQDEGLTAKRVDRTANRMARASDALNFYAQQMFDSTLLRANEMEHLYRWNILKDQPQEIILRVLLKSYDALYPQKYYRPRLEKLEIILDEILEKEADFQAKTLGGCVLRITKEGLLIQKETEGS